MKSYEIVDDSGVDYNFLGDDRPWKGQVVQGNPDPSAYPDAVTVEKPFGLAGTYTASASCFKEHLVGGGWKLDEALAYIREVQPKAMASGWCLMLGGGVLNNGHGPDLDLLAYPRTVGVVRTDLLHHLPRIGSRRTTATANVYAYLHEGKQVELIFQCWRRWSPTEPNNYVRFLRLRDHNGHDRSGWYYCNQQGYWIGPHSHQSEAEIGYDIDYDEEVPK